MYNKEINRASVKKVAVCLYDSETKKAELFLIKD